MGNLGSDFKKGMGPDETDLNFSFPTMNAVATVNPDRAARRLATTAITYAATGQYTIVMPVGTAFPALPLSIQVTPQWDTVAHAFLVAQVGEATYANGQMTILLQTVNSSLAAVAVTPATGSRINVMITASNNGGK